MHSHTTSWIHVHDPDGALPYPAYQDAAFWFDEKLIYGIDEPWLHADYLDRLARDEWNHENALAWLRLSWIKRDTARWFEKYLEAYFGRPVILKYIKASVDGQWFPVYALWYHFTAPEGLDVTVDEIAAQVHRTLRADPGLQERIRTQFALLAISI